MKRNHIFLSLALALLLSAALCLPARAFSKEPSSWAAQQVKHLDSAGLLNWSLYTNSTDPASAIQRGDFCQMLVNLIQMEGDWEKTGKVDPVPNGYFADADSVDSDYGMYYGAAFGITEGSSKNGQRVADAKSRLTREQAAKMMCALIDALETYGGVPAPQESGAKTFTDQSAIASWASEYVARASSMGILQGDNNGKFNPKGTLTWQEACVMVDRVYTSAEKTVKERRAQQGIHLMDTAFEMTADKYIRESAKDIYVLENGGRQSVLFLDSSSGKGIQVETYNADGSSAGIKTIPMELGRCGGFCEGPDAYYLAFGQSNMEENGSKTVFRVVKYDKSWNRLGAADISNCYTTVPFDFTSHTAMAELNGTLILHTSRQRYLTRDDGLRHQSNFTAKIRTADMSVISQSDNFPDNHVSHSFAQYVAFDGSAPVYVDHGDAYPRGFALSVENSQGSVRQQNFFSFYGATGDNTTNAIPGGLGVSGSSYLFAGASSPQTGGDSLKKANAFLSVIPKSGGQAQTKWLTSLSGNSGGYVNDVRLVEVNNNTFVVMWQVTRPGSNFYKFDELQYAVFDGQGNQKGQTKSMPGYIVPPVGADPSVYGNRIVWAKPELDVSDRYNARRNRYIQIFELDISANSPTAQNPAGSSTPSAGTVEPSTPAGSTSTPAGSTSTPAGSTSTPAGSTSTPAGSTSTPAGSTNTPSNNSAGSSTPSADYPTTRCAVNNINITRTDVDDQETTPYYREDWDGNWLEVSVKGNTFYLNGCIQEARYTRAILAVAAAPVTAFINKGQPFSLSAQTDAGTISGGKNITLGVAGDGDIAWDTFRSGVTLQAVLDSYGNPTIQVKLPFWLKDSGSASTSSNNTSNNNANNNNSSSSSSISSPKPSNPSSGQSGQNGGVEYVDGVICTKLPADGVVTRYREEYNGTWLQLDASGSEITFSGCGEVSDIYHNYAVLRSFRVVNETPYRKGVEFRVSVTVDAQALAAFYESEGGPSMITAMLAQNYKPGDSAMGGYGFQSGSRIAVVPDGNGGVALKVTR